MTINNVQITIEKIKRFKKFIGASFARRLKKETRVLDPGFFYFSCS